MVGNRAKALFVGLAATVLAAVPLSAQESERPRMSTMSSLPEEEKTEVMVLATSHLAYLRGVTPAHLDRLIDELAAWSPDVIALERVHAADVVTMRADPYFAKALSTYVGTFGDHAEAAQTSTGLSAMQAIANMHAWQGDPAALAHDERLLRLQTALAAYEVETALLYWRSLRSDGFAAWPDNIGEELHDYLGRLDRATNERVSVGVRLAQDLGLARLWNVDSHLEDPMFATLIGDIMAGAEQMGGMDALAKVTPFLETTALESRSIEEGDLLPLFRYLNSAERERQDVYAQFDVFNRFEFPNQAGRAREALWDVRNYRIAAHLRNATALRPGSRVLLIIGSAHKPWLEELLAATLDVKIVQFNDAAN